MTCDQHELADAAQTLRLLFHDLEVAQHTHTIREARTMRPTPGPMSPTNDNILSLRVELTERLKEMAGECMTHIGADTQAWPEPTTLCTWIRWHAGPISELPVAGDLLEELHDQAAEIRETLAKLPGTDNQDKQPHTEPWQTSRVIITQAAKHGITIDNQMLYSAARHGHIETRKRGNRNTYQLAQVINHFKQGTYTQVAKRHV